MSACISKHGEFSAHTPDDDHICTRCGVLDEDGLIAELHKARAALDLPSVQPPLTDEEHQAVNLTAELWNVLNRVVGHDRSRAGDLQEICWHVHAIQNAVLSQAAARAYPDRYRLLGESLKQSVPVLLDVSRDPQQHPRDESGRYTNPSEES